MSSGATSASIRAELVEALRLDLIGPENSHAFAQELLPESPSKWYLTGFLVPSDALLEDRIDETADDELEEAGDVTGLDDSSAPDRAAAKKSFLPSSMGLSVLLSGGAAQIHTDVEWGDYVFEGAFDEDADTEVQESAAAGPLALRGFRRTPNHERVDLPVPSVGKTEYFDVPNSDGLRLAITTRSASHATGLPAGTKSASVFLVNNRQTTEPAYMARAFQARLQLTVESEFVPRPDLRGSVEGLDDWDEDVADLQYANVFEYAVGHGCSANTEVDANGTCSRVWTVWIPTAEVERVAPAQITSVELGMAVLGSLVDAADATAKLSPLVSAYRTWIQSQKTKVAALAGDRKETGKTLIAQAEFAAQRIEAGIAALADPDVLESFKLANSCMETAARRRSAILNDIDPAKVDPPAWRPFQLAFMLTTLGGVAKPLHADRERVDLLFFPTGGGKTEAYLGLAAFTLVLRRLRHPGIRSAGVSVLMRYTLRLLTLDQLGRASGLICALELEREKRPEKLGDWPFEIGLWVGSAATPNRMGHRGYTGPGKDDTAYIRTKRYNEDSKRHPAPIPLENCPWCGTQFRGGGKSFRMWPSETQPKDLSVRCVNRNCDFSGNRRLPIVAVDEPIYRRLPGFLIATVDKFAALPWTGPTGGLFGLVDRYDGNGFYGPCDPRMGGSLGGHLPPPDLIIQDELHLISGPLGTIAGIYETAIDTLASRSAAQQRLRPKIIASTATVRRADSQIRALFDRADVSIFPPQGPNRRDSFFAETLTSDVSPARLYVGVAAQGRSSKVVLLRTALALLSAGQTLYAKSGGKKNQKNPADPYMTMMGYFNSLRELGGSRRIVEDNVRTRLENYGRRRRLDPQDDLFSDRTINYEVVELTSRVSTNKVATAKRRLELPFHEKERVDVALATNMISVGLDIVRLGLMTVLGQPKTSAEYIQATSRVGRDVDKPGLVITLLNIHKPRDRSHYERFKMYHDTFYRAVEPTSVN
ncbi:MAG: helicase, partial [Verrucomicrobia bacterium]|nr:helicase [Verrucomicrobiota bacterium]